MGKLQAIWDFIEQTYELDAGASDISLLILVNGTVLFLVGALLWIGRNTKERRWIEVTGLDEWEEEAIRRQVQDLLEQKTGRDDPEKGFI